MKGFNLDKDMSTQSKPPRSPNGKTCQITTPTTKVTAIAAAATTTTKTPEKSSAHKGSSDKMPSATATPSNTPNKDTAMYDRSLQRLKATDQKKKHIEMTMMESCTFTPDMHISKSKSTATGTTPKNKENTDYHHTTHSTGKSSAASAASPSDRVEELYRDGVKKLKQRVMTNKHEEDARQKRLQERELTKCTFRPNLDWKVKKNEMMTMTTTSTSTRNTTTPKVVRVMQPAGNVSPLRVEGFLG